MSPAVPYGGLSTVPLVSLSEPFPLKAEGALIAYCMQSIEDPSSPLPIYE